MAVSDLAYTKPPGAPASPTSNTTTRPADTTAYASGDLVANSTTAGSVVPLTWASGAAAGVSLVGVRLRKSGTGVTNAQFRIHLFSASPTVANGDNGALAPALKAPYLGYVDVTVALATGDGSVGVGYVAVPVPLVTGTSGALYGLIEARGAYTPASAETFNADLLLVRC